MDSTPKSLWADKRSSVPTSLLSIQVQEYKSHFFLSFYLTPRLRQPEEVVFCSLSAILHAQRQEKKAPPKDLSKTHPLQKNPAQPGRRETLHSSRAMDIK